MQRRINEASAGLHAADLLHLEDVEAVLLGTDAECQVLAGQGMDTFNC